MASIHPFRALRPAPDAAPAVSSVPYDVVSTEEARGARVGESAQLPARHALRDRFSGRHRPVLAAGVRQGAREPGGAARARAARDRRDAVALPLPPAHGRVTSRPASPAVSRWTSTTRTSSRSTSARAATRRTIARATSSSCARRRASSSWSTSADTGIDALARQVTAGEPLYDFTADDGVRHTVWRAGLDQTAGLVNAFARIPALYIADGHHRAASAARARAEIATRTPATSEEAEHVHRRRVSRQPGADPPVPPHGQGSRGPHPRAVPRGPARAVHR